MTNSLYRNWRITGESRRKPRVDLALTDILSSFTSLSRYDLDSPACSRVVTYGTVDAATFRTALSTD
ncbi:hypothetical protein ACFPM1_13190 [Halorubrum rubrum]|uniref:Uncharacterized protein n=1 Tax=Halorubrum rubrum TaxID=1126240 RepID=A0ABD5R3Y6_9EURY